MSDMTDYLEDALLDHVLNGVAYTPPSSIYIGLFTAAPSDAGGGTEVSGGSYARVQVTAGFSTDDTDTRYSNDSDITFPVATASWGTVTHLGIFDAASGGNLLLYKALPSSVAVATANQPVLSADGLGVTLT